jgi:F-type H+-transporting ATPase subunit b
VQVYAIARRVLKDLADEDLEEKIATVMVTRIQDLKDDEKTKFMESLKEGNRLIVQSAYEIPPGARKKLDDVVKRFIAADIEVEYERSPEVMTGFEMKTDGHKIAWSVNDYLNTLEENFIEALYAESREKQEIQSKEGAEA